MVSLLFSLTTWMNSYCPAGFTPAWRWQSDRKEAAAAWHPDGRASARCGFSGTRSALRMIWHASDEFARGIDQSEVVPNRPTKSISAEDTFEHDVLLAETEPTIRRLAERIWAAAGNESRIGRTVVLKLKTCDFYILTRSCTPSELPASCEEVTNIALSLRERVGLDPGQQFPLIGVGLGNFRDLDDSPEQSALFE